MNLLTDKLFMELIKSASLAPSADNMQPWEFSRKSDSIEVFASKKRMMPTDVSDMFTWVSIGAAMQNIVLTLARNRYRSDIKYPSHEKPDQPVAIITVSQGYADGRLAEWIPARSTNRSNYENTPPGDDMISYLTRSIEGLEAGIYWVTDPGKFRMVASLDARSSFIRLEHKPTHDELFNVLRFSRKQMLDTRYGLDYESLGVPAVAVFIARQLQHWSVNRLVSKSGIGRLVAKMLSMKLVRAGGLCLITAKQRDPEGYMKAGRAMEQLWLAASSEGLSIHPYGALPQYLTKAELEPGTFLPSHLAIIKRHRDPFYSIFPGAEKEYPAIVLRAGLAGKASARSDVRLRSEEIVRK
ncbi:MAG TPA: hypothetical protein VK155_10745 [Bacteroidales bacterium]|nr:hypothetical protein [Bacteroidales bacterium]